FREQVPDEEEDEERDRADRDRLEPAPVEPEPARRQRAERALRFGRGSRSRWCGDGGSRHLRRLRVRGFLPKDGRGAHVLPPEEAVLTASSKPNTLPLFFAA